MHLAGETHRGDAGVLALIHRIHDRSGCLDPLMGVHLHPTRMR